MMSNLVEQNDIIIGSWPELCERVYDGSWQSHIGCFRSNYAFRGLGDKSYHLTSSYKRNFGNKAELEYHLLRNFRKYSQDGELNLNYSDWQCMTIAQHHGLPTRLLDWTYSPFVAMHFATNETEKYDSDGVIWEVDYVRVNHLLPSPLVDQLNNVGANAFTIGMLEDVISDIQDFDKLVPNDQILYFEPPSIDSRIVNQFALFSVMSSPTSDHEEWLIRHPELYRRLIIPQELKWEIRDKLDQANITERMLFPGLDGLAEWLKRHYQPRI
ncbi:MAG: FRG domain-containing protein [Dehalococcoidales bacterium]|nr:FRG domain-containing protein [Dehalococcoidales bacterium]